MIETKVKIKGPATPLDGYYWIAINGASCAASLDHPMSIAVEVTPTPQNLIGFPTSAEARAVQELCLTGSMEEIGKRLHALFEREDVVFKIYEHSEPATEGPTLWLDKMVTRQVPRQPKAKI